jgi:hypothetical protein
LGDAARASGGGFEIAGNAVGTIRFYLDETSVAPPEGAEQIWRDLGDGTGGQAYGFDMNQDGEIGPPQASASMALLKNNPAALGIIQMPIDIVVTFFADETHKVEIYSQARRLVIAESRDLPSLLVP